MNDLNKPVIILGMHRSGTSFLSRQLEQMGLYQGRVKDSNNESFFFLRLNNWLLKQCGASWGEPEPLLRAIDEPRFRKLLVSHMKYRLSSFEAAYYYKAKSCFVGEGDFLWGWKDPRTTFTLPLWLEIFPEARVVSIRRHGVDVAASLNKRANDWIEGYGDLNFAKHLKLKYRGYGDSFNSLTLQAAFDMWAMYEAKVEWIANQLNDRFIQIRYEDIPTNGSAVDELLSFLDMDSRFVDQIQSGYDESRMFRYKDNAELCLLAERNSKELGKYGY